MCDCCGPCSGSRFVGGKGALRLWQVLECPTKMSGAQKAAAVRRAIAGHRPVWISKGRWKRIRDKLYFAHVDNYSPAW